MDLRLWIYFITWMLSLTGAFNQMRAGCNSQYHPDGCFYSVNCTDYLNLDRDSDFRRYSYCENGFYNGYQNFPPIHITYRRTHFDDAYTINWNSDVYTFIKAVVKLDLSHNQYKNLMPLSDMPNLKVLNISNNLLTVAKLSNRISYNSLINIDFSFNVINVINVNKNERIYGKLETLDLSHNVIDNIPDTVFDLFSELKHLNLSYNRLTVLNVLSFIGLKSLKSLLLDNNDIIDINSSLLRLRELQDLSLHNNKLESVSKRDFERLISLQSLDLSSNKILDIGKNSFDNMTVLSEIDLSENALDVIDKETFKYTINLNKIDLSVNKLKCLPKELFKGKTMSYFSIENNILEGKLVNGMFLGLNYTTSLDITYQYITSIEDYAFTGLDKLEILLLNNNKINNISAYSFHLLQKIKRLDLSNNYILNIDFEKDHLINLLSFSLKNNLLYELNEKTFKFLNRLQFLDLSYNNITIIGNNTFENLKSLLTYEIRNNPLVNTLNAKIFNGLTNVPDLDISQSEIILVKNNTFQNMEQLKYLNLSHNCIQDLQFNTFIFTSHIETIDLSHNKLTYFLVNTTDLQNLGTLLLNNNSITAISTSTLKNLHSLLKLNYSYNKIEIINENAFLDQKSLLYLDLSSNPSLVFKFKFLSLLQNLQKLTLSRTMTDINSTRFNNTQLTQLEICYSHISKVTNTSFNNFERLENLILSNNEMSKINNDTFYKLIYLQHLDLSNNHIKFIQSGSFKNNHQLKILYLSHNSLVAFNYGALRGLISLDILDVSFNNIVNLQKEILIEAENLKVLIADNNQIDDIDYDLNDIHLSELSIGDNPIPCKRVYELRRRLSFAITSLTKNEHNDNINGIKCHKDYRKDKVEHYPNVNNDTDRILNILKNIINTPSQTSDERPDTDDLHLTKITDIIQRSNSEVVQQLQLLNEASSSIKSDNNEIHVLLERLLRVLVTMNSAIRPPVIPPRENASLNDLTAYVSKIKEELENDIIIQKESVLAEVDSKISLAAARGKYKENVIENEKPLQNNTKFIEICLALLLTMSCGFLMFKTYKWYKTRFGWRPVSCSRRHITESLENTNL